MRPVGGVGRGMRASGRVEAVIVVLDGLRPDMVTADVMPNLAGFRTRATTFVNARSVFPSVTPAAAASLATGAFPGTHGVLGSEVYWPDIARDRVLDLDDHRVVRGLEQALPGGLVAAATLGDVLAASKRMLAIVDGGVPVVASLINPRAVRHGHWSFSTADRLASPTPKAWDDVVARFGYPPERELPRFEEIRFATTVMTEHVIGELAPSVAVLWLSEPDATSRYREVGALETENVLRHVDRQLGRVLDAIERRQGLDGTLVVVASDHGQITATSGIDVGGLMRTAGLTVDEKGRIGSSGLVFAGRGYGSLTGTSRQAEKLRRAAHWLLEQPWVGNVLMSGGNDVEGAVPGTLSFSLGQLANPRAADIYFTFASDLGLDRNGMAGRGLSDARTAGCGGTHGGLNPFEMGTLLMIGGPGFAHGAVCLGTAGVVDIAPTVLARLGLPPLSGASGRDLSRLSTEPRRTLKVEAGRGGAAQHVVIAEAGGRRLEAGGRGRG